MRAASGVLPAPHAVIASAADVDAVDDALLPGILKTARLGYDGKGQVRVATRAELRAAFAAHERRALRAREAAAAAPPKSR